MYAQNQSQHRQLADLLDGGEWACASAQSGTLSHVCLQLSTLLPDRARAAQAAQVAVLADRDLSSATRLWGELADSLR